MTAIEIARRCAELKDIDAAQKAYMLVLDDNEDPAVELEAAAYLLYSGGDALLAMSRLVPLFNSGNFQQEAMDLLLEHIYAKSAAEQETLYALNMRKLMQYPYFFANGNKPLPFEDLPRRFFPFKSRGYIPFNMETSRFEDFINPSHEEITHYFFDGSQKPIYVEDLYSQYEMDYLYDCTRRSEDIARDNHIYIHFGSWTEFCCYAQIIDFTKDMPMKKLMFLIEDEKKRYPIDFKTEYGVDYSLNDVKPIYVSEIKRMIWHVQLSYHNGGDFFNEVLDNHPNLIYITSLMFDNITSVADYCHKYILSNGMNNLDNMQVSISGHYIPPSLLKKLLDKTKGTPSYKDIFVALFLVNMEVNGVTVDSSSRFAPVFLFQPHFGSIDYKISFSEKKSVASLSCDEYDKIKKHPLFKEFKYVKAFIPLRRFTTSYAASVKFAINLHVKDNDNFFIYNMLSHRLLNQSFLHDVDDKLYNDSRIVRFEDGKTNPKATFTELAEFLDIPYTESMTYCSEFGRRDVETMEGNAVGFDLDPVYRTYDDFTSDNLRRMVEYYMSDAMKYYGYDMQYYKGEEITEEFIDRAIADETEIYNTRQGEMFKKRFEKEKPELNFDEWWTPQLAGSSKYTAISDLNEKKLINQLLSVKQNKMQFKNSIGKDMVYTKPIIPNPDMLIAPLYK